MDMSKYLSIEEQEKVLVNLLNTNNDKALINALKRGCTLTAPVVAIIICSQENKVGNFIQYAKNFTKEAVMLLLGAEPVDMPYWNYCIGVGSEFMPNPKLAFELHKEETLNYLAEKNRWHALFTLLSSYSFSQKTKENYYTILNFLRMNAPQEMKEEYKLE